MENDCCPWGSDIEPTSEDGEAPINFLLFCSPFVRVFLPFIATSISMTASSTQTKHCFRVARFGPNPERRHEAARKPIYAQRGCERRLRRQSMRFQRRIRRKESGWG